MSILKGVAANTSIQTGMPERVSSLTNLLADREAKEVADIAAVLTELKQAIEGELSGPEYMQLELFTTSERDQYRRNVAALETRLAQIPVEIERETAQIRARYADPQPRLFPVAVTFLVPERLAR
jgi:hypothetical protein